MGRHGVRQLTDVQSAQPRKKMLQSWRILLGVSLESCKEVTAHGVEVGAALRLLMISACAEHLASYADCFTRLCRSNEASAICSAVGESPLSSNRLASM